MGRSVARQLAEKGANVIIVARDVAKLQEATVYISVRAIITPTLAISNQHPDTRKEQLLPPPSDFTI
jgi:short-subunit dehydrogenase